ncbi:MAG: biotin/lipoyl-binding protein [bacterium]|nr:biotin/lipoyl-binding protein [bacterium]
MKKDKIQDIQNIQNMLDEVIDIFLTEELVELEVKDNEKRVRIKRAVARETATLAGEEFVTIAPTRKKKLPEENIDWKKWKKITSPLTGTFYGSSSPDIPPYVEIGSIITPGQTLGLLEAMKMFNEIKAEISGKIMKILVQSGETVNAGDTLFLVESME